VSTWKRLSNSSREGWIYIGILVLTYLIVIGALYAIEVG
jgi:hypothetical protein